MIKSVEKPCRSGAGSFMRRLRIAHDEEDCHEIQSKSFRASLAGPSDRSGVGTRIIAKIFSRTDLIPRHHDCSLEAARHARSIPYAHHFRPLQTLIQDRPAIDTHSRRHTPTVSSNPFLDHRRGDELLSALQPSFPPRGRSKNALHCVLQQGADQGKANCEFPIIWRRFFQDILAHWSGAAPR